MATILVVDDEPDVVEIVSYRLRQDGHTIFTAANGEEALTAVAVHHPDLMILDVMMPGIDGFEVVQRLKRHPNASLAQTPVMMLTAKTDRQSIAHGWSQDVDNYVTKPFKPDELAKTVSAVLAFRGKA